MELKQYQRQVIVDLEQFLATLDKSDNPAAGFKAYWADKQIAVAEGETESDETPYLLKPYHSIIPGVPSVCFKVPTAGGKTLIGIHAVEAWYNHYHLNTRKVVVWLVPSLTILDQTIRNFRNPDHPYCQKWQALFQNRVQIITKEEALAGSPFNPESVHSMLNVLVLSFDSFRTQNKEGRKVYQENGNLTGFTTEPWGRQYPAKKIIEKADMTSLAQVLNNLNPLVVIDESHNAVSSLSTDMLKNLNPSFILELTATPKEQSNIISYVNALVLKKDNMVKLPVIVYNNEDAAHVINSAISLQTKLEAAALEEEAITGAYIRPIVLFQAEPRIGFRSEPDIGKEAVTFAKIKEKLVQYGIPPEQIAIKTADINDLKGITLEGRDCPIRYILTVNALKEGWDCPFAYILAAIANRSSPINVEQILGRILRQPYVKNHKNDLLNMSYVLTSSAKFLESLPAIVTGLQLAGFSAHDYRVKQEQLTEQLDVKKLSKAADDPCLDLIDSLPVPALNSTPSENTENIISVALQANKEFTALIDQADKEQVFADSRSFLADLGKYQAMYKIRSNYKPVTDRLLIPRFFETADAGLFNDGPSNEKLVSKVSLLADFKLSQQAADISLEGGSADIYKIDIETPMSVASSEPQYMRLNETEAQTFLNFVNALSPEGQRQEILARIWKTINRHDFIEDGELRDYVKRIISGLSNTEMEMVKQNPYSFAEKIKQKIDQIIGQYAARRFSLLASSGKIFSKCSWRFTAAISPLETVTSLPKMLYDKEEKPNNFELKVINEAANLPHVLFWHRNIERKGFYLNGWINHYPDFIIYTQKKNLILLETKGDDRDNSNSVEKLKLGKQWEHLAGRNYRYFMVFDQNPVNEALRLDEFIGVMKNL
jgi:type III restriction enzyme